MLEILKKRFNDHMERHPSIPWEYVEKRLTDHPNALTVLQRMEETGGEPDVIGIDQESGEIIFCDCSAESPAGRRSLCYDEPALLGRKKNPPDGSAAGQAQRMGVQLLTEDLYQKLQSLRECDLKTSSWIATPDAVRKLGGALFCERRYGVVFTFHNGADSYYAARGWRGYLRV